MNPIAYRVSDSYVCPYCPVELEDPGAFVAHLEQHAKGKGHD